MKKAWPFVALGVLAYLLFAIVTLPAHLVLDRMRPAIDAGGVEGSVWRGSAQVVRVGGTNLGALTWKLHVLPLLRLRTQAEVRVSRTDGFAQGVVSASGSNIRIADFAAAIPLATLPPQVAPGGWSGMLNARLSELVLVDGWPTSAAGDVEVADLTGPASRPAKLGSYAIKFPAPSSPPDVLAGTLNDVAGPIQIAGTIQLKAADRSYLIDGQVATKPDAPADFARTLEFLGPPDAQGRRPFSLSGTL
jgi:general secretion pathway protein N